MRPGPARSQRQSPDNPCVAAIGLDESVVKIPGLFLQNRYNFSQDLRISSRGLGARSSFGIRGLKVFVDGIPAALPDRQTSVEGIEIGSIERIEVMRGPQINATAGHFFEPAPSRHFCGGLSIRYVFGS